MSDSGEITKNRFSSYRQKRGDQRLKGLHLASLSEDRRWKGKKAWTKEREGSLNSSFYQDEFTLAIMKPFPQ